MSKNLFVILFAVLLSAEVSYSGDPQTIMEWGKSDGWCPDPQYHHPVPAPEPHVFTPEELETLRKSHDAWQLKRRIHNGEDVEIPDELKPYFN